MCVVHLTHHAASHLVVNLWSSINSKLCHSITGISLSHSMFNLWTPINILLKTKLVLSVYYFCTVLYNSVCCTLAILTWPSFIRGFDNLNNNKKKITSECVIESEYHIIYINIYDSVLYCMLMYLYLVLKIFA